MVSITPVSTPLQDSKAQGIVFFLEQDAVLEPQMRTAAQKYFPLIDEVFKAQEFTGKAGSRLLLPGGHGSELKALMFFGLGKKNSSGVIDIEQYRRALGRAIKAIQEKKMTSAVCMLPDATLFGVTLEYLAEQTAIIAEMATYRFDEFLSDEHARLNKNIDLHVHVKDIEKAKKGFAQGAIIATAVNKCRHWVDTPPSRLTPEVLANYALEIAKKYTLPITVYDEATIKKMGMGGLEAVSMGSDQDCRFVVMEYKTTEKNAPTLAFVGKGITFDSGGLSIKPADSMETMKEDMSGAAAVIATMEVIAQLKPKVNVIGIAPLAENLPSGKAAKPGDIVRFYNGKTAEIRNTDAEGRLILADALSYAVKHYKPDAIIDLATLTGACSYALGPFFAGLMSQHRELSERVEKAAQISGDRVWPLPLHNDYKAAIKSPVADICNIGSRKYRAGAITAAFFLQAFVNDVPWLHLDIAGTAFDVPDISYFNAGEATGYGVRLLTAVAMNW